jgi:hypothetical protein
MVVIMVKFEKELMEYKPDIVLVGGYYFHYSLYGNG